MSFEVTRATLKGWEVKNPPTTSDGLYLELRLKDTGSKKCTPWRLLLAGWKCLRCKCLRRRGKVSDEEAIRRTPVVPEHTEVVWQKYNSSNILIALFTCSGRAWRVKRGKPTILVCDIFRHSTVGAPSEKLLTLHGEFTPGVSHKVTLTHAQNSSEQLYKEVTTVVLDIRHATHRPFALERARPCEPLQLVLESDKAASTRKGPLWLSTIITGKRTQGRPDWFSNISGHHFPGGHRLSGMVTNVHTGQNVHAPPTSRGSFMKGLTGATTGGTIDMESLGGASGPSSGPATTQASRLTLGVGQSRTESGFVPSGGPIRSSSHFTVDTEESIGSLDHRGHKKAAWILWRSSEEVYQWGRNALERNASGTLGSSGFEQGLLANVNSHTKDSLDGQSQENSPMSGNGFRHATSATPAMPTYSHWLPHIEEWRKIWPNHWPAVGDDLGGKHEVAPLMEAQFRKDCIIFFNTLFPRWRQGKFAELRMHALNPTSKLAFKQVPSLPTESAPPMKRSETQHLTQGLAKQLFLRPFQIGVFSETTTVKPTPGATPGSTDSTIQLGQEISSRKLLSVDTMTPSARISGTSPGVTPPALTPSATLPVLNPLSSGHTSAFHSDRAEHTTEIEGSILAGQNGFRERRHSGSQSRISFGSEKEAILPSEASDKMSPGLPGADGVLSATSSIMRGSGSSCQSEASVAHMTEKSSRQHEHVSFSAQVLTTGESSEECGNTSNPLSHFQSHATLQTNSDRLEPPTSSFLQDSSAPPGIDNGHLRFLKTVTNLDGCKFYDDYSPRILFLKRLFICFVTCGLYYSEEGSPLEVAARRLWPYPIASVLGHGSRVLIRLEDVDASEFLCFLISGGPDNLNWVLGGVPAPLVKRTAATHAVALEDSGDLIEKKLKVTNLEDNLQNLQDGRKGKHLGLNLPIGGVGSPSPMGKDCWVSFSGRVASRNLKDDERGLGNLMVRLRRNSTAMFENGLKGSAEKRGSSQSLASSNDGDVETGSVGHQSEGSAPSRASRGSRRSNFSRRTRQSLVSAVSALRRGSRRGSRTSKGSGSPSPTADDGTEPREGGSWKHVPAVQGGHLYIRIDDFGQRPHRTGAQEEFMTSRGPIRKSNVLRRLVGKQHRPASLYRLTLAYQDRATQATAAGSLSFPSSIADSRRASSFASMPPRSEVDVAFGVFPLGENATPSRPPGEESAAKPSEEDPIVLDALGRTLRILRVRSMPSLLQGGSSPPTMEDVKWVRSVMMTETRGPLPAPETLDALRLLLETYQSSAVRLIGKHGARTLEDLFDELISGKSALWKRGRGLQRFVETVVLQLKWKDHLLAAMPEVHSWAKNGQTQENTQADSYDFSRWGSETAGPPRVGSTAFRLPCSRVIAEENWEKAMKRFLRFDLSVHEDAFLKCLRPWEGRHGCYTVIEDTASTPGYPGLKTCYRTHIVQWEITDRGRAFFDNRGLQHGDPELNLLETTGPLGQALQYHFMTIKDVLPVCKSIFWRWIPMNQVLQEYHWLCTQHMPPERLPVATDAQVWAYRAAQQEGVVGAPPLGAPPSEAALRMLLDRCGYDAPVPNEEEYFEAEGLHPLSVLFNDLCSKKCHLLLKEKTLLHVAEVMLIRVKLRGKTLVRVVPPPEEDAFSTITGGMLTGETPREAMERILKDELAIVPFTIKGPLDNAKVLIHEETGQALFPGLLSLCRVHLATVELKDAAMQRRRSHHSLASLIDSTSSAVDPASDEALPLRRICLEAMNKGNKFKRFGCEDDEQAPEFMWVLSEEWEEAHDDIEERWWRVGEKRSKAKRRVASVLLGLEGSEPHANSPFNIKHDASGSSKEISALGNRKWRAFRMNDALQIPSDHGGMRLDITKRMFDELVEVCETLDLVDPSEDLRLDTDHGLARPLLEQRYFEEEMFKQILGGSVQEARRAIDWACRFRQKCKTSGQVFKNINSPSRR